MDDKLFDPELLSEAWKELGHSDQQEVTGPRVVPCHSFTSRVHITWHKKSNNPTPRKRGHTKVSKLTGGRSRGAFENLRAGSAGEASLQTTVAADRCHRSHRRRHRLAQQWNYLAQG